MQTNPVEAPEEAETIRVQQLDLFINPFCDLLNLARKVNFSPPGFDKVGATNNEKGTTHFAYTETVVCTRKINKGEPFHVQF